MAGRGFYLGAVDVIGALNVPEESAAPKPEWLEALEASQVRHEQRIDAILCRFEKRLGPAGQGGDQLVQQLNSSGTTSASASKAAAVEEDKPFAAGFVPSEPGMKNPKPPDGDRSMMPLVPSATVMLKDNEDRQGSELLKKGTKAWVDRGSMSVKQQIEQMSKIRNQIRNGVDFRAQVRMVLSQRHQDEHLTFQQRLNKFIKSNLFENLSCFAIIVNAALIGVEIDYELANPGHVTTSVFRTVNGFFLIIFSGELLLRICAEGTRFVSVHNPNISWNAFDMVLVLSSLFEEILGAMIEGINVTVLRIFRMLRIVRSLRIIRVLRVFKDLRIMIHGIFKSGKSLVWAAMLLVSLMYLTSVCLLQFASEEITAKTLNPLDGSLDDDNYRYLKKYYMSLFRTVYTLFLCISGGVDWGDAAEPLLALNYFLIMIFCLYISFSVLCVLNIITGVFVDNATRHGSQDEEYLMLEQVDERKNWFEEVQELFRTADEDGSGEIDGEEFAKKMQDVRLQAWFQKIGVQVETYSAQGLFELLDFSDDGRLTLDEFTIALKSVHGQARSIDLAKVGRDARLLRRDVSALLELLLLVCKAMDIDTKSVMDQRNAYLRVQAEGALEARRQAHVESEGE